MNSLTWAKARKFALERDNFRCCDCGTGEKLHVHHMVPRSMGGTHDLDNLITLCAKCHGKAEFSAQQGSPWWPSQMPVVVWDRYRRWSEELRDGFLLAMGKGD